MAVHKSERDTLGFEMWMLHRTQEQITRWDAEKFKATHPEEVYLYIAVLESLLVHARNLIRFFYPPPNPDADDLMPADFFADRGQRWYAKHRQMPAMMKTWLDGINTALSHVSGVRPATNIDWKELEIRAALDKLFAEFNALGPEGGAVEARHSGLKR
jgi:spermidine/putrescine-binding protein